MAAITLATEPKVETVAFTSKGRGAWESPLGAANHGWSSAISPLNLSSRQRLDNIVETVSQLPFGGTDCALPMLYALDRGLAVDTFVIYTDSETWAGSLHPSQALRQLPRAHGHRGEAHRRRHGVERVQRSRTPTTRACSTLWDSTPLLLSSWPTSLRGGFSPWPAQQRGPGATPTSVRP
ncbi:MAG: hypothetical protein V9E94_06310 [Microthrixaceae bacterium]